MAHITHLGGVPRVSRVPIQVPNLSREQRVTTAVMAGAGQAVSHAALSSLSPASATIEDITDQVGEGDLMKQAADFIASMNAQAGLSSNGGLASAHQQQMMATSPRHVQVTGQIPIAASEVAGPCVGHAHVQQLLLGLEQSQLTCNGGDEE